jgi:hypothetical protein
MAARTLPGHRHTRPGAPAKDHHPVSHSEPWQQTLERRWNGAEAA